MKYNVIEIFNSIEGEGKRQGELCTFIRLAGCNLRCGYCDTVYAQITENAKEHSLGEIIDWVNENSYSKKVTVTGGEPLLHENIEQLLDALVCNGFEINIETNGSFSLKEIIQKYPTNIFFSLDYKLSNSGMSNFMLIENWQYLRNYDVLKFVVSDSEELNEIHNLLYSFRLNEQRLPCKNIYISPVIEKVSPVRIIELMEEHSEILSSCRLQLQLHKRINVK